MPLSTTGNASINAATTSDVWAVCVSISHADLTSTLYLTSNATAFSHGGNTHQPHGLGLNLPDEVPDKIGTVDLMVEDTAGTIQAALADLDVTTENRPAVSLTIVDMEEPNVAQVGPFTLEMVSYRYTPTVESSATVLTLQLPNLAREPFPGVLMRPDNFPGLF